MKKIILIAASVFMAFVCFSQQIADTTRRVSNGRIRPTVKGTVVHRNSKTCPVVVQVILPNKTDTMFLLPMSNALDGFDAEGTVITFRYSRLMVKQPMGCSGIPARIWDIQKVADTVSKSNNKKTPHKTKEANGKVIRGDNKNCPVLICVVSTQNDTSYFIPMNMKLDSLVGKKISFQYTNLMVRQPMGCKGNPIHIADVGVIVDRRMKH